MIRGKKTKAKGNNRKRPSLVQRKNENRKKKRRNRCPVQFGDLKSSTEVVCQLLYPEELFASQVNLISQELSLKQDFRRSLKNNPDLFKSHVALYKRKAGNVSQQEIQSDFILP